MASKDHEFVTVPDPVWDIFADPIAIPGATTERRYYRQSPETPVQGQTFGSQALSRIQFTVNSPLSWFQLNESFIQMSMTVRQAANQQPFTGAAIAFDPAASFIQRANLRLGDHTVESSNNLLPVTTWVRRMLSWDRAAADAQGASELMCYHDPVIAPVNQNTYPQTVNGPGSTNVAPITAVSANPGDPITNVTPNAAYSESFWKRAYLTANGRALTIRIPLTSLFSFVNASLPALRAQNIQIEVEPTAPQFLLHRVSGVGDGEVVVQDCTLFCKEVVPRSDVNAQLLEGIKEDRTMIHQWLAAVTIRSNVNSSNVLSLSSTLVGNPAFVCVTFLPAAWHQGTQTAPFHCSLPPNAIINRSPFASARLSIGSHSFPEVPFGGTTADLVRMYRFYEEACDQISESGGGAYLTFDEFCHNAFILTFDVRNRSQGSAVNASAGQSYTLDIQLNETPSAQWVAYITSFGVMSAELKHSQLGGLTILPLS